MRGNRKAMRKAATDEPPTMQPIRGAATKNSGGAFVF